jgi:hypothetical protein
MRDIFNDIKRNADVENVQLVDIEENELEILVKSWRHTTNGEIDEGLLYQAIIDALGDVSGLKIKVYQDGEEWANVYVSRIEKAAG